MNRVDFDEKVRIDGVVYERVDGYMSHDIDKIPEVSGKPLVKRTLKEDKVNYLETNYNELFLATKTVNMTKADAYFFKTLYKLMKMEYCTFGTAYAEYIQIPYKNALKEEDIPEVTFQEKVFDRIVGEVNSLTAADMYPPMYKRIPLTEEEKLAIHKKFCLYLGFNEDYYDTFVKAGALNEFPFPMCKVIYLYNNEVGYNEKEIKKEIIQESINEHVTHLVSYDEFELFMFYYGLGKREESYPIPEEYIGELSYERMISLDGIAKPVQDRLAKLLASLTEMIGNELANANGDNTEIRQTMENLRAPKVGFTFLAMYKDNFIAKDVRPKYKDGTPSHTSYLNNAIYEYDLSKGELPITSFRAQAWKSAIKETLWIYQDQSNDLSLLKDKHNIAWWDEFESKDLPGTIGQRYGATVKKYDMVNKLLKSLKENPFDRRQIMDMLQFSDLQETDGLFPCAYSTTWNVRGEYLDMILNQRSSDFLMAWSINQFQYATLLIMIAKAVGLKPGKFTHVIGNVHIYDRHFAGARELLERTPSPENKPVLHFDPVEEDNFYAYSLRDFVLEGYVPDEKQLKFELAI